MKAQEAYLRARLSFQNITWLSNAEKQRIIAKIDALISSCSTENSIEPLVEAKASKIAGVKGTKKPRSTVRRFIHKVLQ